MNHLVSFRTEIKYLLLGVVGLGGLIGLSQSGLLGGFSDHLAEFMEDALTLGLLGLAVGAFVSNALVLINIPFTLVAVTFFLVHGDLADAAAFALATGLGGGLGKLLAYTLASGAAAQVESLSQSALFGWFDRMARQHPRWIPALAFGGIVAALPNDLVLLPAALIHYPVRRLTLPVIGAKLVHNFGLALIMMYAVGLSGEALTPSARVDVTAAIVVITVLAILYQIEKARAQRSLSPR